MPEPIAPTQEQLDEVVKTAPTFKMDSRIPLQQQAGKLNKFLEATKPKEEAEKGEPKDDSETGRETIEEPQKEESAILPDEGDEDSEVLTPQAVTLDPVGKYILDKLPTLTVRVKDGEGTKVLSFKDTTDLPEGFEIATDADRAKFTVDVASQLARAKDVLAEYKQTELNENIRKFQEQEAEDVAADISYLQKRGILPEFQYKEDDPKFNGDPAVKTANEIYDLYIKTNQQYAQKYANTGRTYRISYRDAADKYFARQGRTKADDSQKAVEQPDKPEAKKTPKATQERQQVARQQGAPQGGEPSGNKFRPRPGMKLSDINRLVSQGRI